MNFGPGCIFQVKERLPKGRYSTRRNDVCVTLYCIKHADFENRQLRGELVDWWQKSNIFGRKNWRIQSRKKREVYNVIPSSELSVIVSHSTKTVIKDSFLLFTAF
jgi:hypothetical protein